MDIPDTYRFYLIGNNDNNNKKIESINKQLDIINNKIEINSNNYDILIKANSVTNDYSNNTDKYHLAFFQLEANLLNSSVELQVGTSELYIYLQDINISLCYPAAAADTNSNYKRFVIVQTLGSTTTEYMNFYQLVPPSAQLSASINNADTPLINLVVITELNDITV